MPGLRMGKIVSMALWDVFLKERTLEEYLSLGAVWLQDEERARADELTNPLSEAKERIWGGRKYGLDMAELAEFPVYLESSEEGFGLYKRLGFEMLNEKIVHRAGLLCAEKDVELPLIVKIPRDWNGVLKDIRLSSERAHG
ncbi:uncharacterized protein GLRG_08064 [Colletotrichum graminicola M1.001]|uniref:Uncharacterized protein n=1 Tax=Colletotrichum graminicola (strain M1.001 / M2 / FGSC 10212) TaxID=645133 RepID=E3QPY2_COLGM|nr:uncharacterized protein GLRG_08064 [Colletotrichum graminicola M1.001]EFQ32920.1 hypothetical protein GLRG_08064 [Colletotrichum graminicola M1.001]